MEIHKIMNPQKITFYEWEKELHKDLLILYRDYLRDTVMEDNGFDLTAVEDYDDWARQEYEQGIRDGKIVEPLDTFKPFNITSVCLEDLGGIGFDISNVNDGTMAHLASKMADAYCDNGFWIDLPIIAEALDIPKLNK